MKTALFILSTIALGWGCKSSTPPSSEVQGTIVAGKEYLWPGATAGVCWEKNLPQVSWDQHAKIREKIAQAVTEQFGEAGFKFTGWGICEPGSRGIRVESWIPALNMSPTGMVQAFGARLDGLSGGLGLYVQWDPKAKEKNCQNEEYCIVGTALHEFGHAVGLRHEMNRAGSPCPEDQLGGFGGGNQGDIPLTPYDPNSIMNYCALRAASKIGRWPELSPDDKDTIRMIYSIGLVSMTEEACQKDGFSWVSGGTSSCCRTGKKEVDFTKPYPQCPADYNSQFADKFPTKDQPMPFTERFVSESKVSISAELPWEGKLATLSCWNGEVKGKQSQKGFEFTLIQPSDPNFQIFTCDSAIFYNSSGVDTSSDAVIFFKEFEFPIQKNTSLNLLATEGIRVPIAQGKLQMTPALQEKLATLKPVKTPPLGSHATNAVSTTQAFKINDLKGKLFVYQSSLSCVIDGKDQTISSGLTMNEYVETTMINKTKILEYNFPNMKTPATCSKITLIFKRPKEDESFLETTLNFRTPIVVTPFNGNPVFEMTMPECVKKLAI